MHSITSLSRIGCARPGIARLGLAIAAGVLLSHCTSAPKSEVVVSVKDQRMGLYHDGVLKKEYVVSTSKFGLGDKPNSYCTPTGKHEVIAKIGHGLPTGAVLKSRHWNGEVLKPNAPGRDPIVSRILWLRGLENSNRNAMKRFIYIHGTTEENRLGKPASYGCIRMGMRDVVDVFNEVSIGAKVVVTKNHLPGGKKEQHVKEVPAVEPVVNPVPVPAPIAPPIEIPTLASTSAKPAKSNKASAAPAMTAPEPVVTQQPAKSSFFSFLPWSRAKSKSPEAMAPAENIPSPQKVTASNTPSKRSIRPSQEHQIGPAVPEPLARNKSKKDRVEKVSSSSSTNANRLIGFNTQG